MQGKQHLKMQVKALAKDGAFEGRVAVYNNVDLGGDLIEAGAFTKSIKEHGDEVPLLWQHDPKRPIGMLTLVDGPDALSVNGQLCMEVEDGKNAYLLIKANIVRGLSIGYDTVRDSVESGVRRLKEIRLWEGSIVTFPMNAEAMVTAIKARSLVHEAAARSAAASDRSGLPAFLKASLAASPDAEAARILQSIKELIPRS
jgi:HK97 family phage prohead protease